VFVYVCVFSICVCMSAFVCVCVYLWLCSVLYEVVSIHTEMTM